MRRLVRWPTLALAALLGLGGWSPLQAQQTGSVSGRVVDARTLQPVASAQVFIPSLNTGALTRDDGRFLLVNVRPGTHTVNAQVIGFRTATAQVTVAAGQTATADFQLQQDALALDEIIVTGTPGGTQRRAIGNVVTRVSAEEVSEKAPIANMQEMLSGRAPGLDFQRSSGNIGTGSSIRIRGVSSLSLGTQPLIYVDGVRIDNSASQGPQIRGGAQSSALDDINPDDIASIEVIKGPAAATLYGTEASAGVIQIITKKGQSGAPQFTLSVNQGSNFMIDPAGKIGDQYACTARSCAVTTPAASRGEIYRFNIYEHEKSLGNDVFQNGHTQGYGLSVRGGTDAVRYYLSADMDDQEGIVDYNWNKRTSMRANVGVLITEGLNLDVSTGYSTGTTSYMQQLAEGGIWENMFWAQGSLLETPLRGFLRYTPEDLATVEATRDFARFTGSATVTHTPFEWLTQRLIVGLDRGADENQVLVPRHPLGNQGPFRNLSLGDVRLTRPINTEVSLDWSASAKYGLGPSMQWTSSVGAQYFSSEENSIISRGSVFASPAIRSIEGATNKTVGQTFIQNKSLGVFVQQELAYADKLYLTGAVRADDNSAFGSEFNAAIYPKLSLAYVLNEEPFFEPLTGVVSSLRLRSAWGQAGRQPPTFAAVTLYDPFVGPGGSAAVTPRTLGNAEVGPEVSTELELGFDAAFLEDRLSTEFTYYTRRTDDALLAVPLPPTMGFSGAQDTNLGRLDSWGWELGTNARLVEQRNWALDLGFSGAYTMNEIKDLGGVPEQESLRVGLPYPIYTSDVIVSAEMNEFGVPFNVMCDAGTGRRGLEIGGPAVPCSETSDYALMLGPTFTPWTWSFNSTLTLFENFQLFGMVEGEFGRWGSDTNAYCRHTPCYPNTVASLERSDPKFVEGVVFFSRHPSDGRMFIRYDADFWKLREVGARYTIPESIARRFGVDNAALSISGRNLWTIWQKTTDINGATISDPELTDPNGGSALGQMPGISGISASLRVNF